MQNPSSQQLPRPLSLWERARERATSRKACIWAIRALGKVAEIRRMPSPQPSPTGEGAGYSDFCGCRQFEKQLGFTAVDFRSSEKQKAARTTCFPCRTFNPNSHPVLSPRGRELERGQQAARLVLGRLGCRERLLQFGRCPLPSPPPRGRGQVAADSSVTGRLKKNARNINSRNFSGSFYRKADVTNAASVFSDGL